MFLRESKHVRSQGQSQKSTQVPQSFMKAFKVDDVIQEINIASETIINYRVTSPSNHSLRKTWNFGYNTFFFFLRSPSKIFKLLKPIHTYTYTLLYQFQKKLKKPFPTNIYLFKVRIATLRQGVKVVQG